MVKREVSSKIYEIGILGPEMEIMKETPWSRIREQNSVYKEFLEIVGTRWPCKDYLKGTCTNSLCEKWHPPECLFYKTKSGCRFGEKCSYAHRQVDEQPSKKVQKE